MVGSTTSGQRGRRDERRRHRDLQFAVDVLHRESAARPGGVDRDRLGDPHAAAVRDAPERTIGLARDRAGHLHREPHRQLASLRERRRTRRTARVRPRARRSARPPRRDRRRRPAPRAAPRARRARDARPRSRSGPGTATAAGGHRTRRRGTARRRGRPHRCGPSSPESPPHSAPSPGESKTRKSGVGRTFRSAAGPSRKRAEPDTRPCAGDRAVIASFGVEGNSAFTSGAASGARGCRA
jgi:hypothetical protein